MRGIHGESGRRWLAPTAASLCALLAFVPAARAEGTSAVLQVTARVVRHASLRQLDHPASFTIRESDLARGYVDLPAVARLAVRSNSQDGYLLVFESDSDLVRQAVVTGLDREVAVGGSGMVAQGPIGPGMGSRLYQLGFRFLLSAAAHPGRHPWPLRVAVVPR